jgi:transmembrane sensor
MKRPPASSSLASADATPPATGCDPLEWAQKAGRVEPVLQAIERHARRRRQHRLAAGGVVLAVMLVAGFLWRWDKSMASANFAPMPAAMVLYPARQVLPDGSVVELRADAVITVDFHGALRRVVLQRGEAHFQVTKNPARSFVVEAAGWSVRAVGTAFAVEVGSKSVDVLVTEGRVAVADAADAAIGSTPNSLSDAAPKPTVVHAGQRLFAETAIGTTRGVVQAASESEMKLRLAWRVPRLEFNGTSLTDVVTLFNRHTNPRDSVRLVLADPTLGKLPLSGVLRADNVPVLLSILESSYGLKAERKDDGSMVLFRP